MLGIFTRKYIMSRVQEVELEIIAIEEKLDALSEAVEKLTPKQKQKVGKRKVGRPRKNAPKAK